MSIRTRVLGMVDVFMRVPPLFVIDEILKISMGLPSMSSPASSATSTISRPVIGSPSHGVGDMEDSMLESFVSGAFEAINETLNASMDGSAAAGVAADLGSEDYFKVLSLTTLKFFTCLVGECWLAAARAISRFSGLPGSSKYIMIDKQYSFISRYIYRICIPCTSNQHTHTHCGFIEKKKKTTRN